MLMFFQSWTILVLAIAATHAFNKCCPAGQSLVRFKGQPKCNDTSETGWFLRSNGFDSGYNLPNCSGEVIHEVLVHGQRYPKDSCVDTFGADPNITQVLHCGEEKAKFSEKVVVKKPFQMLKCCPENSFYNATKHECENFEIEMTLTEKYSYIILDREPALFYVNISIPRCEYALVDYSIDNYDLTIDQETGDLKVTIRKRNEHMIFDKGTFCRDVTSEGKSIARVCHQHHQPVCVDRPCVRKCCNDGEVGKIFCKIFFTIHSK